MPLLAVEQGFNGRFELGPEDADVLVRVEGGDVLWQKERLLNVGVQTLPACEALAWLDCDIIFENTGWVDDAWAALERYELVQLFHERHDLPPRNPLDAMHGWTVPATAESAIHRLAMGAPLEHLAEAEAIRSFRSTAGLAWASRRATMERHGLYDACILGGGDRATMCGGLGAFDQAQRAMRANSRRTEHYLVWARPFHATVGGRVGCIPGRLFHLWHGDLRDRRYRDRHALLADYDPFTDIAADAGGCWRWSSRKPELQEAVRQYFEQRREDGDSEAPRVARAESSFHLG